MEGILFYLAAYSLGVATGVWVVAKTSSRVAASSPPMMRWRRSSRPPSEKARQLPPVDFELVEKVTSDEHLVELEQLETEREAMRRRSGVPR